MLTHQLIAAVRAHHSTTVRKARLGVLDGARACIDPVVQPQAAKKRGERCGGGGASGATVEAAAPAPQSSPAVCYVAHVDVTETPEDQPRSLPRAALGGASPTAPPRFAAFISPLLRFWLAEEGSYESSPCTSAPASPAFAAAAPEWPPLPPAFNPQELVYEVRELQSRVERLEGRVQGASERVAAAHTALGAHLRVVEGRVLALEASLLRSRGHAVFDALRLTASAPPGRHATPANGACRGPREQHRPAETAWGVATACFNPLYAQHRSPQAREGGVPPEGAAGSGCSARAGADAGEGLSPTAAAEQPVPGSWEGPPPGGAQEVLRSLRARVAEAATALEEARGALGGALSPLKMTHLNV